MIEPNLSKDGGYAAVNLPSGQVVIAPAPIMSDQFSTLEELEELIKAQALPYGYLTKAAFYKCEMMVHRGKQYSA